MRNRELPTWVTVLLVLVGIVVLGPPVLGLVLGALGVAVGLAAVLLKLGIIALVVYAVFSLLKAMFGGPSQATARGGVETVDDTARRFDEERRAVDEQLRQAVEASTPRAS